MPLIALLLFAAFAVLGFGWRSWLQHRRTGSTGFKGISGRPGSTEWLAGIQMAGIMLALFGIAGTVYAQLDMGDSWRIGVDPAERTTLVRSGVFGRVRNPIFTAMLVFGLGIALVTPNVLAVLGFALLLLTIEMQVRMVEEPYLADVHGDAYREYTATVGRFIPAVGLIQRR